jgi:hypothetical protein
VNYPCLVLSFKVYEPSVTGEENAFLTYSASKLYMFFVIASNINGVVNIILL